MSVCSADGIDGIIAALPPPDPLLAGGEEFLCVRGKRISMAAPISLDQCQQFCRNVRRIGVTHGTPVGKPQQNGGRKEDGGGGGNWASLISDLLSSACQEEEDGEAKGLHPVDPRLWALVLKASDRMRDQRFDFFFCFFVLLKLASRFLPYF
jgi:hypothetical protein